MFLAQCYLPATGEMWMCEFADVVMGKMQMKTADVWVKCRGADKDGHAEYFRRCGHAGNKFSGLWYDIGGGGGVGSTWGEERRELVKCVTCT